MAEKKNDAAKSCIQKSRANESPQSWTLNAFSQSKRLNEIIGIDISG